MTEIFSLAQKTKARKAKRNLWLIWGVAFAVYLAIVITLIAVDIYIVTVYRDRSYMLWMMLVCIAASILFGGFSLFFFSIKFRLTSKYVRMLKDIERGLRDTIEAKFISYDESITNKDGVFFYSMILDTRPLRREDITERKMLVEQTVPKPQLIEGTVMRVVSHANILVSYEILSQPENKKQEINLTQKEEI